MSTLSLRLPSSLHEEVKKLARREGISIKAREYGGRREARGAHDRGAPGEARSAGCKRKFQKVLRKVRNVEPEAEDRL